jgi:3-hydroxybutyryl-CoA dehydratase
MSGAALDERARQIEPQYRPGYRLSAPKRHVTQDMIDRYAEASGDFNPIHVDPDYARTGPFGRTIAHGMMTLAFAAELLNDWTGGAFDEAGEIEVVFVGPVFAGDVVELSAAVEEIVEREGRAAARVSLGCSCGDRQILVGTVFQFIDTKEA